MNVSVMSIRTEQIKRSSMNEQRRPKHTLNFKDPVPIGAAVGRTEDKRRGTLEFLAVWSEKVVRSYVVPVGQNSNTGRTDIKAGRGRTVTDDPAGNSRHKPIRR